MSRKCINLTKIIIILDQLFNCIHILWDDFTNPDNFTALRGFGRSPLDYLWHVGINEFF